MEALYLLRWINTVWRKECTALIICALEVQPQRRLMQEAQEQKVGTSESHMPSALTFLNMGKRFFQIWARSTLIGRKFPRETGHKDEPSLHSGLVTVNVKTIVTAVRVFNHGRVIEMVEEELPISSRPALINARRKTVLLMRKTDYWMVNKVGGSRSQYVKTPPPLARSSFMYTRGNPQFDPEGHPI
ncbi:hypothetical protein BDP27DRAFT_1362167 [Rhodocollybia butyracea]|uniref:Uncharacterized protein n=1 Tax=Rhodocollybia butyracea TaxID=206335 RepID=A0A9P5U9G3_9AGAR|nr:hypothetical protein BDP27DRAFT_1362167 [Rhodocollybia butyracea]